MLGFHEYINPIHFELIEPLKKWKILSLKDLKDETKIKKSDASIYKIIKRLEQNEIIDSFIDSWSKEKHIYLDQKAKDHFDLEISELIPRDRRYHDALTVKLVRAFLKDGIAHKAFSEQELKKMLTKHDHLPDSAIKIAKNNQEYFLAIETELNQKNKRRIHDYFNYFINSKVFDNALYIFNRHSIYQTYKDQIDQVKDGNNKILLMYIEDLRLDNIRFKKAKIYHNGQEKSFEELFLKPPE